MHLMRIKQMLKIPFQIITEPEKCQSQLFVESFEAPEKLDQGHTIYANTKKKKKNKKC